MREKDFYTHFFVCEVTALNFATASSKTSKDIAFTASYGQIA